MKFLISKAVFHRYYFLLFLFSALMLITLPAAAQDDDLLSLLGEDELEKEYVRNAFKSARVINAHSMEFIADGVLDFRILHRFGPLNTGAYELFGLDQATMRMGFDFGIRPNLTAGFGRSTFYKELDGFIKYRPVWQSTGPGSIPFSLVLVSGITLNTLRWAEPDRVNFFTSRMGYYHQIIIGRKFTESFTLQLAPTMVHRNLIELSADDNDIFSLGIGSRMRLTRRVTFNLDYFYNFNGFPATLNHNPLSIGFDIETGGHVFQLHFTNARGMNERAFITETNQSWQDGDVRFGFNISRVFTIRPPKR